MQTVRRHIPTAARILLGLVFTVFGLNYFLGFLPEPQHAGEAGALLGAMFAAGYLFPLIKITEIVAGLMLLSNRFVPLALLLLAPVIVNIVAFHAALEPASIGIGLGVVGLSLVLAWSHRDVFRVVLQPRNEPVSPKLARPIAHAPAV